jgi:hypothetical protein
MKRENLTYLHSEAGMVVRMSHVSVVKKPHVSDIEHFISFHLKELFEVFRWLHKIAEPDHSWQIGLSSLQESSSQLHRVGVGSQLCL